MCYFFPLMASCWEKAVLDRKGNPAQCLSYESVWFHMNTQAWQHFCALRSLTAQTSRVMSVALPFLFSSNPGVLGQVPYAVVHLFALASWALAPSPASLLMPINPTPCCWTVVDSGSGHTVHPVVLLSSTALGSSCGFNFYKNTFPPGWEGKILLRENSVKIVGLQSSDKQPGHSIWMEVCHFEV